MPVHFFTMTPFRVTDEVPEEIYELEKTDLIRLQMSSEKYKVWLAVLLKKMKKKKYLK